MLAATEISFRHVLLTFEPQGGKGGSFVAAITVWLLLAQSTPAPGILLAVLQRYTVWLLSSYNTYIIAKKRYRTTVQTNMLSQQN